DDSIGVASLPAVARLARPGPGTGPLWLVATVGEEGTGNLAGIRHALGHAPQPVAAVVAVEGDYLGRVVIAGVGSVRWRVSYHGPGGHAWERSQAPSAVHAAAQASALLTGLAVAGARCSVNIGTIGGGEAINARAREAWFEVDLRADSAPALASLVSQAGRIVRAADDQIRVSIDEIGSRPAGGIAESSALARAAGAAHGRAGGPGRGGAGGRAGGAPGGEHRRECRLRGRDPRRRPRCHQRRGRAHPGGMDPDGTGRRRPRRARGDDPAIQGGAAVTEPGSGVVLQGVDPPKEFCRRVEEIESLGFGYLWLT